MAHDARRSLVSCAACNACIFITVMVSYWISCPARARAQRLQAIPVDRQDAGDEHDGLRRLPHIDPTSRTNEPPPAALVSRFDASGSRSTVAQATWEESSLDFSTPEKPDRVTFKNGLQFEFPSSSSKAHLGVLIQQDWAWFAQDATLRSVATVGDLQEAVFFRRARIKFDGTALDFIEWDFDSEQLANETVAFDDLWIGVKSLPVIGNVRVGHVKLPQGLESVTSNRVFTFLERASNFDAFYREYGAGMLVFNNWAEDNGTWAVCLHRIDRNGDGIDVGDGEYAATARLTALPIASEDDEVLLHIGTSASVRSAKWDSGLGRRTIRVRSRPEFRIARQTPFIVDTGAVTANEAVVLGAELAITRGPCSLQAEYTASSILGRESLAGVPIDDVWFHGGYLQLSYFLTGEHRPYDHRLGRMAKLTPDRSVGKGSLAGGAWELASRFSWLDLNDADLQAGQMTGWTIGLNWYWTAFYRMQFNYIMTERDVAGQGGMAHAFLTRLSLDL